MTERLSLSLRLALFYAALFSVVGVQLPFWPLYLSAKGMDPVAIGQILAAAYFIKILTNPLVGHAVDQRGGRRRPLIALAAASLLFTGLFAVADGFVALLLVTALSSAAFTAMMPLCDSLTMQSSLSHSLDYGRVRLWGSLSFIAVAGLAGITLVEAPRACILWSTMACMALTLLAAYHLPDLRAERPKSRPHPLGPLLQSRPFLLFLGASSLTQVSHMIYYGFATLHWRAAGLSGGVIGALWGEGVIAEVVLFAFGARLIARFGPIRLIAAAGAAGMLRWTVLAATSDPLALAAVQVLHAFTFGANHLGAMHFINRAAPPGLSARAQGIYSSVAQGIIPGVAMLISGGLYQALGGGAFLIMSAVSAAGFLTALALKRRWHGGQVV
jgi:PPP family 3-phenylpropionic acid transporter